MHLWNSEPSDSHLNPNRVIFFLLCYNIIWICISTSGSLDQGEVISSM